MMRLLSLDLSSSTGWSLFVDGVLNCYGSYKVKVQDFNVNDRPEKAKSYPANILEAAKAVSNFVFGQVILHGPNHVVIENTVKGRNRNTQRLLEFIHQNVLNDLIGHGMPFTYMDPSEWRSVLELRLSKADKESNKLVSQKKKRGRINKKHLSIRLANELFDLKLKLKDNDISDSILLGKAYLVRQEKKTNE